MNWFMDLDDAREKIEEFRVDYNTVRPHSSIYDLPPEEFIYLHQTNLNSLVKTVIDNSMTSKNLKLFFYLFRILGRNKLLPKPRQ